MSNNALSINDIKTVKAFIIFISNAFLIFTFEF